MCVTAFVAVFTLIETGFRAVLTSCQNGEALNQLSDALMDVEALLTAGAVAIKVVEGAGGGPFTEGACGGHALQLDSEAVVDEDDGELR